MRFLSKAREDFKIEPIISEDMSLFINKCILIYQGRPAWVNKNEHINTINFAKAICSETARLVTLELAITISGSVRADWLQEQMEKVRPKLRHWVEYGCATGTIILKPNLETVDVFSPDRFVVTDQSNGEITGAVFFNQETSNDGKKFYSRLEYHRFLEDGTYAVSNRCYEGNSHNDISKPIDISKTPWAGLLEEVYIENIDRPLFGVFRTPQANNLDFNTPLGMPIFSDALQELKDLDIAYSRNAKEIQDSKRTVLIDSDRMIPNGGITPTASGMERQREEMGLPDMVKNVYSTGTESFYQEINPNLNTDVRLQGINALLSQIGFKSGFNNGYFVFNEKTGLTTATQVEADQQRTIQFVGDVRERLEDAVKGLVYALNAMADLYNLAPAGLYNEDEILHCADITRNFEEERQHHYALAMQGHFPWEEYYVRFLKYSRERARELLAMAKAEQEAPSLFGMAEE
ncbi:MAG: hypothetical protein IJZ44_02140 [Lachnospiraceae bacterium]|nr:hypothetical protein [Lachnospiraceae bacterium]